MPQRVVAILNPAAGQGRARRAWRTVEPALRDAGLSVETVVEERPGQAVAQAAEAARRGCQVIAAVGGDGTIHEVVNGILAASPAPAPALAVIPGGTGNDFARGLGLPRDPLAAGRLILTGARRWVDVGRVNDRYFVGIAGVGFDAEVAARVNGWPKWIGGTALYVAAILTLLATYRCVPVRLWLDGREERLRLFLLAAANTPWYAGGMYMAPPARPDDGQLEIITARDLGTLETLGLLPKVFSGAHLRHAKVAHRSAREARVEGEVALAIHADGETIGRLPAVFGVVPQAVEVIVPAAAPPAAAPRSPR